MAEKIRVIVVDDLKETRDSVTLMLQFEHDIEIVAQAANGEEGVALVKQHRPDVVVMDVNMPLMDGITASRVMIEEVPNTQVIIMSVQSDRDYIRGAMRAGARDFLTKPFSVDELLSTVRNAYRRRQETAAAPPRPAEPERAAAAGQGHIIAVFSPSGGVGCTMVAVNTAVALAQRGFSTVLVDGDLQFGDVSIMLKMRPTTTLCDLAEHSDGLGADLVGSVTVGHRSGLKVLLGPPRPDMGVAITAAQIRQILEMLRRMYQFVVVDTSSTLDDISLGIMDMADRVLLLTRQQLTSLKNASRFIDVSRELAYSQDKVVLVVNGAAEQRTIPFKEIGSILKRPVACVIPDGGALVEDAITEGVALVDPATRPSAVARALGNVAGYLAQNLQAVPGAVNGLGGRRLGFLSRLLSRWRRPAQSH